MANPYLVNAVFGQLPANTAPVAHKEATIASVPTSNPPLVPTNPSPRTEGDACTRNSEAQNATIHPARQVLMHSGETIQEDQSTKTFALNPTGSNKLPLGEKNALQVSTPRHPMPISMAAANTLRFPPERYLPPSGAFYDEPDLPRLFGLGFFAFHKCTSCWKAGHRHPATRCGQVCSLCRTRDHSGKSCPLLYCTVEWLVAKNVPIRSDNFQIRPSVHDLDLLLQLGLFDPPGKNNGRCMPTMSHPIARNFYKDRAAPRLVNRRISRAEGKKYRMAQEQQLRLSPSSESFINQSLDPRRRDRSTFPISSQEEISGNLSTTSSAADLDHQARREADLRPPLRFPLAVTTSQATSALYSTFPSVAQMETESRIQGLEDQVLELQRIDVAKDREIRRLKNEVEQLKKERVENTDDRGNKRPRL